MKPSASKFPRHQPIFTRRQLLYLLYLVEDDIDLNDEHPEIAHEVMGTLELYFKLKEE